ncbi:MAG: hypothetical protein V2J51_05200 [Erythrobacter sp.]|nr:hypothetical protein [Erythrobacter sp.]
MAKNTIVIRSVIVPLSNAASNVVQLMTRGVGVRDIKEKTPTKLVEIDQHLSNLDRRVRLEALMARDRQDRKALARHEAELKLLDDADRRMSIWPLIEAGEFSTISEGLTEADAAIGEGKWADWLQGQIERIPQILAEKINRNLLKNAPAIASRLDLSGGLHAASGDLVEAIDTLTTLYALDETPAEALDLVVGLAKSEPEGMDYLTYYLADLRRKELLKLDALGSEKQTAILNSYKGYIPSEAREGRG